MQKCVIVMKETSAIQFSEEAALNDFFVTVGLDNITFYTHLKCFRN